MVVRWCPSHGKKPHWQPVAPFVAAEIRTINDKADSAATEARDAAAALCFNATAQQEEVQAWTKRALNRLHAGLMRQMTLAGFPEEAAVCFPGPAAPLNPDGPGSPLAGRLDASLGAAHTEIPDTESRSRTGEAVAADSSNDSDGPRFPAGSPGAGNGTRSHSCPGGFR
jgi:hypothetical protein